MALLLSFFSLYHLSAKAQDPQFKALIFSKTEGYRHKSIPDGIQALKLLAQKHVFEVYATEDASIFSEEGLDDFDLVILLNTTGDILNEKQQIAFEKFVQSGKGVVGIHSATDTEYEWEWFNKMIGSQFKNHPAQQTAQIKVKNNNHPASYHLPENWLWTDEWYAFKNFNDQVRVLLELNEETYDPGTKDENPMGMGKFHPISWYHHFDGGRIFYTALGHVKSAYEDEIFLKHVYGGIWWAAKGYPMD
ncbi:ThuA domain-containing protein [Echinicola jeungdonensis]|uniref:ThuA domain-containing protein n=1 Tax=Echinicola jeungdonensis TaxID=709343 RepID=A0ABV5J3F1_9BACT|nr:ThuA domain-containing protein [Echinicola jeungdonensis]MDN3669577.1 ThuA domain-containing protein [Echinicola jeungdonensis]